MLSFKQRQLVLIFIVILIKSCVPYLVLKDKFITCIPICLFYFQKHTCADMLISYRYNKGPRTCTTVGFDDKPSFRKIIISIK